MDSDEDGFDYEDGGVDEEDLYLTEPKQILYDIVPYREWEQEPEVLLIFSNRQLRVRLILLVNFFHKSLSLDLDLISRFQVNIFTTYISCFCKPLQLLYLNH